MQGNAASLLPAGNPLGIPSGVTASGSRFIAACFAVVRLLEHDVHVGGVLENGLSPNYPTSHLRSLKKVKNKCEIVTFLKGARLSFMSGNESAVILR